MRVSIIAGLALAVIATGAAAEPASCIGRATGPGDARLSVFQSQDKAGALTPPYVTLVIGGTGEPAQVYAVLDPNPNGSAELKNVHLLYSVSPLGPVRSRTYQLVVTSGEREIWRSSDWRLRPTQQRDDEMRGYQSEALAGPVHTGAPPERAEFLASFSAGQPIRVMAEGDQGEVFLDRSLAAPVPTERQAMWRKATAEALAEAASHPCGPGPRVEMPTFPMEPPWPSVYLSAAGARLIKAPSVDDIDFYRPVAGKAATAVIDCEVARNGVPSGCRRVRDAPAVPGYDEAALWLSRRFVFEDAVGKGVRIAIEWRRKGGGYRVVDKL